ncbi:MAG: diguanylate cyclase [Deltaproteobacteria bacterium]|jgi:diguanylate cyclase (GGDEF)-like protein|nr:diguanylate cyclase [Deltaproteobacteria bacterium]
MERQNILCVDDEPGVLSVLSEMITESGYDCDVAQDGLEALEKLKQTSFSIVITDLEMPRMNGMDLIREITKEYPELDSIAITAYNNKYQYTDLIEIGASDFITKPFHINELQAKLNRIIRERTFKEKLTELSMKDGLTNMNNRRSFDIRLHTEVGRAIRQKYALFLLLFDIDRFKNYNDQYGHQEGDAVLMAIKKVIARSTRKNVDVGYRYGGDEFALIIPQANSRQCIKIAKRLCKNYQAGGFEPTSLSVGIAELEGIGEDVDAIITNLVRQTDKALYDCKKKGGDGIVFYEKEEHS